VTLKTAVIMLKIQLCITRINYILKYIQIENSYIIYNISLLGEHKRSLSKTFKYLTDTKLIHVTNCPNINETPRFT